MTAQLLLTTMFQNHKQGHMFSFITVKVLGGFMKFFLHCSIVVHTTLSQIQWCDFCIENLNLDFVFVIPTSSLFSLFFTGFKC